MTRTWMAISAVAMWLLPAGVRAQDEAGAQTVVSPSPTLPAGSLTGDAQSYSSGTWSPETQRVPTGPTGISGGDFIPGMDTSPGLYDGSRPKTAIRIPKFHVVKEGETLWDLCKHYYGDPWAWPQLWAENAAITNPHWIYPGDQIKLIGHQELADRPTGGAHAEVIRVAGDISYTPGTPTYEQQGFVTPAQIKQAGRVVGSRTARLMMAESDAIYIDGDDGFAPQVGDMYSAYKIERPLRGPDRDLGHIVEIVATVRIAKVTDEGIATGEIINSRYVVERGDYVGPLRRLHKQVTPVPANVDLTAHVVAAMRPVNMMGVDDVVFLDRGSEDGVKLGNRFLVYQRGDAYRTVYQDKIRDNPRFPYETVAEILVLEVHDRSSVGVITRAVREILTDDHVRLTRGY